MPLIIAKKIGMNKEQNLRIANQIKKYFVFKIWSKEN